MPKLSELFPDKEIIVEMPVGLQVTLWANMNRITFEVYDELQAKLKAAAGKEDNRADVIEALTIFCSAVTKWDVEDEKGKMLALDPDVLYKELGPMSSLPIMQAFTQAVNPTAEE